MTTYMKKKMETWQESDTKYSRIWNVLMENLIQMGLSVQISRIWSD